MWYNTTIVSLVVFILWFPQECTPNDPCREFLLKETQLPKIEIIQDLNRDPKSIKEDYHPKKELTPDQIKIAYSGSLFMEATKLCPQNQGSNQPLIGTNLQATCPFLEPIYCNRSAIYRSVDGSCNNLQQPYWGKANTPFSRFLAAEYADGIQQPRCESVAGGPLPGPRDITIQFHRMSTINDLNKELSHLVMSFGQFVNHEVTSTLHNRDIGCCEIDRIVPCPRVPCTDCADKAFYEKCLPIAVPPNDPYFSRYGRTCLKFSRASATPNLHCRFGPKEQLNSQTSYIDCSQVYGTSMEEANSLRTMAGEVNKVSCDELGRAVNNLVKRAELVIEEEGGLLKITPTDNLDLLPHDNKTFCIKPNNYCFIAGDSRVNQNFLLITMHTLFVREHNRIAQLLAQADPSLDDETLYQKARQIHIAQVQHIFYNEYLPKIIGKTLMQTFGLSSLFEGYTRYDPRTQARISNAHAGAAFRFGHSMIRRSFANGRGDQILLSPTLGLTDPFYQPGDAATGFTNGLVNDLAQQMDRLLTDQVVDKLFEFRPGQGTDLASINIQRGRDIGLKPYTQWRRWCGLDVPGDFDDLTDHTRENRNRLRKIYKNVADIDLWTGGLSEIHLKGANVGPTFACILSEQFRAIKYGDRFWYEHNGPTRLSPSQLNSIRTTRLSRILCDNTLINGIQKEPFLVTEDPENDLVGCDSLTALDICPFVRRWSDWSDWSDRSACANSSRSRSRNCISPMNGPCACATNQIEIEKEFCTEV